MVVSAAREESYPMSLSTFGLAFAGGILSFLSPCVLPLIPGYLSFLTGFTPRELEEKQPLSRVLVPALMFVGGFTLVFVALGAASSALGSVLSENQTILTRVGGALVIAFGVLMTGVVKVPWLYGEARIDPSKSSGFGKAAGFVLGMTFAAGWSPCIGPILGSILTFAASAGTARAGMLLLLVYSAGFAVPLLLVAVAYGKLKPVMSWVARHSLSINRTAGVIMIIMGLLLVTGYFGLFTSLVLRWVPGVDIVLPDLAL